MQPSTNKNINKILGRIFSQKNLEHKTILLKQWLIPAHCLLCKSSTQAGLTTPICKQCEPAFLQEDNSCQKCGINISNTIDSVCGKCTTSPPLWHFFYANYIYTGERGYNQALLISQELSLITKINTLDCLEKTKATLPQSSLKKIDRLKSSPSFSPNTQFTKQNAKKTIYQNKHAIIIDDVLTTGSTATQMSKALNKLGFSKIDVWVFARTC